jgi:hypothetical protein
MKELYELKERLIDELKDYGKKDLSGSALETIDTLAHATKNLCKIIEDSEADGNSGYYPYDRNRGSYRRDSMGRYSGNGYSRHGLSDKLRELMDEAPDDSTRMEIKRLIDKI